MALSDTYMSDYQSAIQQVQDAIASWNEGATSKGLNDAVGNHKGITDAQGKNIVEQRGIINSYLNPNSGYTKGLTLEQQMKLQNIDMGGAQKEGSRYGAMYDARTKDIAGMIAKLKEQWQTKVDAAKAAQDAKKGLYDMQFGKERLDAENANAAAARAATIAAAQISAPKSPSFDSQLFKNVDNMASLMVNKYRDSGQGIWNHNIREQIAAALGGGDPTTIAAINGYLKNGFENNY